KELMERAAERGTFIHEQIELADSLGVKPDVTEVQNYLKLKEEYGLKILENEYTVSDLENYATNIDGVYDVEENVVDIADYKTTSKFDKESVSWQLSICAYFLEKDNPKVKVRKLFGIWLRGDIARLIEVERKPVELVKALLLADKNDMPFTWASEIPDYISIEEESIIALSQRKAEIEEELEAIKAQIMERMAADGKKSIDTGKVLITLKAASTQMRFDSKKLMADNEELYNQYLKQTAVKESLTLKVR
ncbi:MAG: hypothetical protein IJ640_10680, partial [Prevotella sp.]|nr:hypothetical protein [Prevotella sp.]